MEKVALITGASGGIGKAIALRLSRDKISIAVHYHTDEKKHIAEEIAEECIKLGAPAVCIVRGDISDKKTCADIIRKVSSEIGSPDILVNCAGIVKFGPVEKITEKNYREVMAVNFDGVFFMIQEAVPYMKKKGVGRIINITSLSAKTGSSGLGVYTGSKAAVEGLSRSAAIELGSFGITVNCISPGFVKTVWADRLTATTIENEEKKIPMRKFAEPENIAAAAAFLASDEAEYITGKVIEVTGGL